MLRNVEAGGRNTLNLEILSSNDKIGEKKIGIGVRFSTCFEKN